MYRAAISIPSNIAEGAGRGTNPDFRRFLFVSLGSANELEYHFLLAKDLKFVPGHVHLGRTRQIEEVRRMLCSFAEALTGGFVEPNG
jgi:four helix bundle protein